MKNCLILNRTKKGKPTDLNPKYTCSIIAL